MEHINRASKVTMPIEEGVALYGDLVVPPDAFALVIFSHGSGSSRFSMRNRHVAEMLNKEKIATLLTDLLTESEDRHYDSRFDIDLITERLIKIATLMKQRTELREMKIGFFGASTGAASALRAAAYLGSTINAVVSRGGRPDLAGESITRVKAPTLLLVGSLDNGVIRLNRNAFASLRCERRLDVVPGASHLFVEPGKLDEVARLASGWFAKYLHPDPVLKLV